MDAVCPRFEGNDDNWRARAVAESAANPKEKPAAMSNRLANGVT